MPDSDTSPLGHPIPPATTNPIRSGATAVVLAVFLLAYFALKAGSYSGRSATYDEPIHLTAGYAALVQHDYRVDPTHPPFLRMWAALPLLAAKTGPLDNQRIDRTTPQAWINEAYKYANDFLYAGPDADRNLNLARCMIILLGAATGLLLYAWAREWLGFYPALLVLAGYLLEPNLAAHATLVTTDMGITGFFFGTIYFFWRTCRRFSGWNLAGLALCFSLACVSKFSAVLLVPAGGLLLGLAVWRRNTTITPRRAAGLTALLFVSASATIWAIYGFRYAPSANPDWLFKFEKVAAGFTPVPVVTPVLTWIDAHHLLPNAYTQGFLLSVSLAEPLPGYLAGSISPTGWWYYFPVAFLLKTPLALLILLGAGTVVLVRRHRRLGAMNVLFVVVPVAVYLAIAMSSNICLGLRHILPIYPFVLLVAATTAWEITTRNRGWPPRRLAGTLGLLLVFWLMMFFRVYPHNLTFFNVLAGGPSHGAKYLVDSNLDWGQHLKLLKEWMEENGISRINLAYFGRADPDYYDISYLSLPGTANFNRNTFPQPELPGYVAISSTVQSGVYYLREWRLFYSGFLHLKPVAVIGHTIKVYRVERWPEPVNPGPESDASKFLATQRVLATGLASLNWHDLATQQFQLYLRQRPDDGRAWWQLGKSLLRIHQPDEAAQAFQRAVATDPLEGDFRTALINLLFDEGKSESAIAEARAWVQLQPTNAKAHDLLGITFAATGRLVEAAEEFSRAATLDPANPLYREHLTRAQDPALPGK